MAEENENNGAETLALAQPPAIDEDEGGGGAPEWMATFADLVTLLMCFFVLLFAMSTTQEETFKELVQSLKSALGVQKIPEAGTREGLMMPTPPPEREEQTKEAVDELGGMVQKKLEEIVSDVNELVMFNKLSGMVSVKHTEMGAVITISDVVLFPVAEAEMNAEGLEIMKKIAKVLKQFSYHIRVVGYTDNIPIKTDKYPSNWELSASRACTVVRFLIEHGLDPKMLTAEGYGKYRPVATNDTDQGRAKNRRVEIIYERNSIAGSITDKGL